MLGTQQKINASYDDDNDDDDNNDDFLPNILANHLASISFIYLIT